MSLRRELAASYRGSTFRLCIGITASLMLLQAVLYLPVGMTAFTARVSMALGLLLVIVTSYLAKRLHTLRGEQERLRHQVVELQRATSSEFHA